MPYATIIMAGFLLTVLVATWTLRITRPVDRRSIQPTALNGRVDLNTASAETLEALPGIGPRAAAGIVAYRASHGHFADLSALQRVHGIGPRTVERIRPWATCLPRDVVKQALPPVPSVEPNAPAPPLPFNP